MEMNEYQELAANTAIYPGKGSIDGLVYVSLGLGESGEFQGNVKKILRDDGKDVLNPERKKLMSKELGDQLWYIAMAAKELGFTLEEIAQINVDKLSSRQERGTLQGSGDER